MMENFQKRNEIYLKEFEDTPNKNKAIFLPQCLRNRDCPANVSKEGFECINCGKCNIGKFKKDAEQAGYRVFIVPGGSMVKNILDKNDFKAVFGVACNPELEQAFGMMKDGKIISLYVPLLRDGCVETDVDWRKVRELTGL